jgi:polar amino acid transport system substrate-binding protein
MPNRPRPTRRAAAFLFCALVFLTAHSARAEDAPLRAGVLEEAEPFVVRDASGNLSGFSVELFRLIAARMKRPIAFATAAQDTLFAGLSANTYDVLPGPIAATPDRSGAMLLLQGYAWSEYQFATKPGVHLAALADLRGMRLAVRRDGQYAEWAERNAQRYGFTVLPVASGMQAGRAVLDGTADASLAGSPVQFYIALHQANYTPALSLPETRVHLSAAVRQNETELRDEMEDALRCLKMDGTVARLARQWFGRDPDAEDLENLVVPGYGVPGLSGYDPKPHKAHC